MKKLFLLLLLLPFVFHMHAQKGDLYVGGVGGYITNYKDVVFGLNTSYHVADPLELSLTGLMNPKINVDEYSEESEVKLYSASLDIRYYMMLQRTWAMGPFIGGKYMYVEETYKNAQEYGKRFTTNAFGFNIGWHMRANITDNLKVSGGWHYTSASEDMSHHQLYIGIGYTFNLY